MKASRIAGALALLLVAGGARAQSFIPGNQVDDFGRFTYSTPAAQAEKPLVASRSSLISSNFVDDYGPLVSERAAVQEEYGAAGGEPGMVAQAAERAREKAALDTYQREQFLRAVWSANP